MTELNSLLLTDIKAYLERSTTDAFLIGNVLRWFVHRDSLKQDEYEHIRSQSVNKKTGKPFTTEFGNEKKYSFLHSAKYSIGGDNGWMSSHQKNLGDMITVHRHYENPVATITPIWKTHIIAAWHQVSGVEIDAKLLLPRFTTSSQSTIQHEVEKNDRGTEALMTIDDVHTKNANNEIKTSGEKKCKSKRKIPNRFVHSFKKKKTTVNDTPSYSNLKWAKNANQFVIPKLMRHEQAIIYNLLHLFNGTHNAKKEIGEVFDDIQIEVPEMFDLYHTPHLSTHLLQVFDTIMKQFPINSPYLSAYQAFKRKIKNVFTSDDRKVPIYLKVYFNTWPAKDGNEVVSRKIVDKYWHQLHTKHLLNSSHLAYWFKMHDWLKQTQSGEYFISR